MRGAGRKLALLLGACLCLTMLAKARAVDGGDGTAGSGPDASGLSVSSQVEPEKIRLGQSFWWTIRVPAELGEKLRLPTEIELGDFVEQERRRGKEEVDGKSVTYFQLRLTTFAELGELELPGFELQPVPGDGGSSSVEALAVPPAQVEVISLLEGVEKAEPRDIQGPVPVYRDDYRILVLAGLLLLFALLAWLLRRNPEMAVGAERVLKLPPPRKAHEIALEKLSAIVEEDLLRQGRSQEYFVRINETLREYLGNRYGFFALDLTSRELTEEVRDRLTPGLDLELLARLLRDADMVKFARWKANDQACSAAIDGTHAIVSATRIKPGQENVDQGVSAAADGEVAP